MADTESVFVARTDDLDALKQHFENAKSKTATTVLLEGPLGSGKRALVGELTRNAVAENDDILVWRVTHSDEEDGWATMLRWYGALFAGLHRSPSFRGKVEMALNSALPSEPQRVQQWIREFIDGLKTGAPKPGETQFQVRIPRNSPLLALVEITTAIAKKFPVILDVQNAHLSQSLGVFAMLEALLNETKETQLLTILGIEPRDEASKAWYAMPLIDLIERNDESLAKMTMQPWGEAEVSQYLKSKSLTSDAARLAEICEGRPGFVAEMCDWLNDQAKLGDDLSEIKLTALADATPDASELDLPEGEPKEGERKHAGPDDAERVAYLSALLGLSFPSGLVADMGGYDRDSIDDLMDATDGLYKEMQFSQPLGTWIYQFNKGILRESVLARHTSDEDLDLARRVGAFMERFLVPRGYGFVVKTARLYAQNGAADRANLLRSAALSSDQPLLWAMCQDLVKYFDEVAWPDAMRRTIYMNLVDRMVQTADVNQAEGLFNDAMTWAQEKEDRNMVAWLLFAGSRLDYRRQDLYRARDRGNDSLKMYQALEDKLKVAEVHNHLAMVELSDGNPAAARENIENAESMVDLPQIRAHGEYVRGLIAKRDKKLQDAATHFQKANELAGNAGQGPLALESGLHFGETLLLSRQTEKAADVLTRVVQIAQALQNNARERAAVALLGQAQAALKNFEAALQSATRALELGRELKLEQLEHVDLYNCGFFNLMLGKHHEGVALLRQAKEKAPADPNFKKELLFNLGTGLMQVGEKAEAEANLNEAMALSSQAKDYPKLVRGHDVLAMLQAEKGEQAQAKTHLELALQAADAGDLKAERKALRKKLDELG